VLRARGAWPGDGRSGTINQTIGLQHDQPDSLAVPIGSVIEELDKWIKTTPGQARRDRHEPCKGHVVLDQVGTSATVTVNFPPIGQE